jgi:hypothetical protein
MVPMHCLHRLLLPDSYQQPHNDRRNEQKETPPRIRAMVRRMNV